MKTIMTKPMNKIEKLIAELCPEGVEFRELGEVCKFQRGTSITQKDVTDGDVPVIAGGQKPSYYHNTPNRIGETIAVSGSGAYAGFVSYWTIPVFLSDSFSVNPNLKLNSKYVFYFLKHNQEKIHNTKKGSGVPHVHGSSIAKFQIPIPPLAVQQNIVKILDTFTTLEAELEAELEARKKQYEYYREELLTFGDDVEWKTLAEVGEFRYGFTDRAKNEGNVRFIRITDIDENGKLRVNDSKFLNLTEENENYLLLQGDILLARTGATYGKTMLFNENYQAVYASFLIRIRFKARNILPSYYWHFAQSYFYWDQAKKLVGGGAQPQFNANVLKEIKIPIPPLAEQHRIVAILDKFDALVNDISVGLPAELNARRKQYEYYRNKLLTFKEFPSSGGVAVED